jgi:hypothetical protein
MRNWEGGKLKQRKELKAQGSKLKAKEKIAVW